jgi:hypothetical protein
VGCIGLETGDTNGGPALAGRLGRCGSDGSDISDGAAGAVAGNDANGFTSFGEAADSSGTRVSVVPGSAVKNSFAMRASVTGSGRPAGRNSFPPSEPVVGIRLGSGMSAGRSTSFVLMVLSDLDVIEHGYCVVCENRRGAVEGDQIGRKTSIAYSHKAN